MAAWVRKPAAAAATAVFLFSFTFLIFFKFLLFAFSFTLRIFKFLLSAFFAQGWTDEISEGGVHGTDGTAGHFPRFTIVDNNLFHEIGVWEKQSSAWFQAKTAQSTLRNNVIFNLARAGINFNVRFHMPTHAAASSLPPAFALFVFFIHFIFFLDYVLLRMALVAVIVCMAMSYSTLVVRAVTRAQ